VRSFQSNYEHHKQSAARTDFKQFSGRAHLITADKGWEEVAEYIASWLDELRGQSTR
jgi:esterase/lipase